MKENSLVKILLVDDLPENLFALELILADKKYFFVRANSGNEALKILLRDQDFAIILMDVQMPEMDGFETVELIREIETLKYVPIIFLTGSMDRSMYISKGYQAGAVDYMIKPLIPEIIKNKVAVFVDLYLKANELLIENDQKKKQTEELRVANNELIFQNNEKEMRAAELVIANKELAFQNNEKIKRADELTIANKELAFQDQEKGKRAHELTIANKELVFQNEEKEKRANELITANKELIFQNEEKEKRANELIIANKELIFQDQEKGKRAAELIVANKELKFQNEEKEKRADELIIANKELVFQNEEKEKRKIENIELEALSNSLKEAKVVAELAMLNAEEAKTIAERALQSKQQFLSNMSHEIRTPMNAILGFTKILLKADFTPKQKEYLDAIKTSSDGLLVLINDILDLAKVDAGKMTFEKSPFKIEFSIATMHQVFDLKIKEKNLELVKEYDNKIPSVLLGDAARLHQILLNLLGNAIKFTAKGKITVAVRLLHEDNEKATIEFAITDTGVGIPEDKLEYIFENFQQATSSTSSTFGGTGLGLAICKQLVEKQGGSISVKSTMDEGSTFSFTLSFQKTNEQSKKASGEVELDKEIKNIKILVVEDIKINQLLMKLILDDFKFEYDVADNGKIAIEKLQTETYDIILMDLQMPEMNGFEATEYIRKTMKSTIPIIALTADVTTIDVEKCKDVGMNDYVSKPLDERILYAKISELLKKPSLKNS
jgi:signal transduction histidine kinase/DNA-binding response OmpR family regulator